MTNKKRYMMVMFFCVLLNEGCYLLASYFQWPVWLDMTGTMLAAVMLEPAAGLLVGLVNNFFESVFIFDASSMVYYSLSAAAALLTGVLLKKDDKICWRRIPVVLLLMIVVTGLLSGLLTLWHGGVSTAAIEQLYYERMITSGWEPIAACFGAAMLIKGYDVLASAVLFAVVYGLLPKQLKGGTKS